MAIRVKPTANIVFGTLEAEAVVSHVRFRKSSATTQTTTITLDSAVTVAVGRQLRIPASDFSVLFPDGDLGRAMNRAQVEGYWSGEEFQVDCLTAADTVVNVAGYSQQTNSTWTITEEADA